MKTGRAGGGLGLERFFEEAVLPADPEKVRARMKAAEIKFCRRRASLAQRGDALHKIADVLGGFLQRRRKPGRVRKKNSALWLLANDFGAPRHWPPRRTLCSAPLYCNCPFATSWPPSAPPSGSSNGGKTSD